jgi:serine/threonine protein phosphatase PrpC
MNNGSFSETPVEPAAATPLSTPVSRPRARRWRGGLEAAFASAAGPHHASNEDCCIHAPSAAAPVLCAVADGVGGGAHGDVASNALIRHCAEAPARVYRAPEALAEWLRQGDAVVREAIARRSERAGATTLVAAWFLSAGRAYVVNVGDCRAYRLSPRLFGQGYRIRQLTVDQTYGNLGRPPPPGGKADDPARMVGVGAVGTPPVLREKLGAGEMLLLCSDGLHKFVADAEIAALVGRESGRDASLEDICHALVRAAQDGGSHDDVSALLVKRHGWFGADAGYWGNPNIRVMKGNKV